MKTKLQKLHSAIDRLWEAGWYIHQMESFYHQANEFRWSLNSFLRALKEVPDIIQMGLQNEDGFTKWFHENGKPIRADALLQYLAKARDGVVHREMLKPASSGFVGISEGRGVKLGIGLPIDPLEDSTRGVLKYVGFAAANGDFLAVLADDEESLPCVERTWKLKEYPDDELTDLAYKAWQKAATLVTETLKWIGEKPSEFKLDRAPEQKVRVALFNREKLRSEMLSIRKQMIESGELKEDPDVAHERELKASLKGRPLFTKLG